ncbi:MAG TPA: hypothetical protein VF865_18490 [Acidobacteriaceae bacterium]
MLESFELTVAAMRNNCRPDIDLYGRAHPVVCPHIDVPPSLARPGLFGD